MYQCLYMLERNMRFTIDLISGKPQKYIFISGLAQCDWKFRGPPALEAPLIRSLLSWKFAILTNHEVYVFWQSGKSNVIYFLTLLKIWNLFFACNYSMQSNLVENLFNGCFFITFFLAKNAYIYNKSTFVFLKCFAEMLLNYNDVWLMQAWFNDTLKFRVVNQDSNIETESRSKKLKRYKIIWVIISLNFGR